MKQAAPELLKTSWNAVVLVCKDCRKRGSGPGKGVKNKELVHELRDAYRKDRPRPRVLLTGCMGLCPKRAVAVVAADGKAPTRVVAIGSARQVDEALPLLRGEPEATSARAADKVAAKVVAAADTASPSSVTVAD